ncbi:EGF domain-containing protein [Corallococcus macrosporus DSM 14697]|uniref:EGF domain-containing protein n=2 Tax=Corallococcus macrosporus TaxID=35 RepID=A0A250JZW1_9BACT|nr:EGF domain-containing protein [Corallococcus macrosporus DSM 14697]
MKVIRVAPMRRWLSAVLVSGMLGACGPELEQESPGSEAAPVEGAQSPDAVSAMGGDRYANAVVQGGVVAVLNPNNAVGAPDGNVATFVGLLGGALVLDMGRGEEGTGPLRIYYQGLSLAVIAKVEFLRADMSIISTGQANLLDLGLGTHSALVPFSSTTPYRYVRLRSGVASLYSLDAVEATGSGAGATCGDGRVSHGEQCDDGNRAQGDGCGSTCQVEPGFSCQGTQPSICQDVNECANGTAQCSVNAVCTNTPGSYVCTCRPGYSGNGFTCTDIDECANGTDTCLPGQQCVNTPGGFECAGGACTPPQVQCGAQCVNVSSDPNNCGACGVVCPVSKHCWEGTCVLP